MSDEIRPEQNPSPESDGSRRNFLKVAAGALGACYVGGMGYPVYRYLASPVEKAESATAVKEVVLDQAASLPKNTSLMFKFGSKPAMLIHHDDDTWTAVSAVCTHLGCTAGYEPNEKRIFCPCHGGVYDAKTGANVAGPPPKPLEQFQVKNVDGKVVVSRA
ncbi:MAG: hypothetical protein RL173_1981 [Fibrobacterota bacterium]|jgi:cytochrome b6-f complex iron-sulfur subunit